MIKIQGTYGCNRIAFIFNENISSSKFSQFTCGWTFFFLLIKSPDEVLVSNMDTSRQLILNEQLEDMRQELVRQYEEHQQATELLRQAHMQQMERQREDQEQLQEEIKRLNQQLTQVGMEKLFSPQLK